MKIINILEIRSGIPYDLTSFGIYEEQLENDVVEEAEKYFINLINKDRIVNLNEEEIEFYKDEGSYDFKNGYEIYIMRSYIN